MNLYPKTCNEMERHALTGKVARSLLFHHGRKRGVTGTCQICGSRLKHSHVAISAQGMTYYERHGEEIEAVIESAGGSLPPGTMMLPLMACERAAKAADHPITERKIAAMRTELAASRAADEERRQSPDYAEGTF